MQLPVCAPSLEPQQWGCRCARVWALPTIHSETLFQMSKQHSKTHVCAFRLPGVAHIVTAALAQQRQDDHGRNTAHKRGYVRLESAREETPRKWRRKVLWLLSLQNVGCFENVPLCPPPPTGCKLEWLYLWLQGLSWLVLCINLTQAGVITEKGASLEEMLLRYSCKAFSQLVIKGEGPLRVMPSLGW
jgi:hypothetical protein